MPIWLLVVTVGVPLAWLIAEFRCGKALRITFGILAILALHFVLFTASQVVRGYEKDFMIFSFREMHDLLRAGRTNEVLTAIEAYQHAVTNDTPFSFHGSSALYTSLRGMNTNSEPSPRAYSSKAADGLTGNAQE